MDSKKVTFEEMKNEMVNFVKVRGEKWEKHNKRTKSLLVSSLVELGELAEQFQWKDIDWVPETEEERKEIAFELVDVFNYLFMLMETCEIDFPKYYFEKMEKLDKKYPVDSTALGGKEYYKRKEEYRRSGKNKLY